MPRACTVCAHEKRDEIDAAILAQTPLRKIAEQYGVSSTTIQRHKKHVKQAAVKAVEAKVIERGLNLRQEFDELMAIAKTELSRAEKAKDRAVWHDQVLKMMKMAHSIGMAEARQREKEEDRDYVPDEIKAMIEETITDAELIDDAIDDRHIPDTPDGG